MRRFLIATLASTAASAALADEVDCKNPPDQYSLNICADRSFKESDAALNAAYKKIMTRLADDTATKALLTKAQKAWVAFRDAECDFSSSGVAGGTIYPMVHLLCADDLTSKRTKDFERYLKCEEGDTGCPVPAN